jgi:hypothetical protein
VCASYNHTNAAPNVAVNSQRGQNQSPFGLRVSGGVRHFMCQPSLHLSQRSMVMPPVILWQTWQA